MASPLYAAYRSPRYQRQEFIKDIEASTGNRLLVYFCDESRGISQADVAPIQELLLDCPRDANNECHVDLLIQSSGGSIDAAEKLVYMIRTHATHFRVIVAERAKSAATMIAMASDEILMSSTSELGPIDPQIPFLNAAGNYVYRPARSFLDGLETIKREVEANALNGINPPLNNAYYPVLSQIDPALIHKRVAYPGACSGSGFPCLRL